ncbi:uncharacterized protein MYCFIDRAFT_203687 [Pseudocercospora fijiensis CIRAD86]|uniref:Uncharacterized protein n=1 Tax=Pseudocercospora fijiensis (strain CIRAD86) TaxID=383855 RepID=M3AG72_PSEFD|nr:uncharacterized protein MYCFIDRAFT_203687 [Pseudocercospora fijiensis CIRAD86]EME83591.1 hypothetical protein MYCFIDRAFT_203687 [Pseudocercospora fijiensis CIRAD86]
MTLLVLSPLGLFNAGMFVGNIQIKLLLIPAVVAKGPTPYSLEPRLVFYHLFNVCLDHVSSWVLRTGVGPASKKEAGIFMTSLAYELLAPVAECGDVVEVERYGRILSLQERLHLEACLAIEERKGERLFEVEIWRKVIVWVHWWLRKGAVHKSIYLFAEL